MIDQTKLDFLKSMTMGTFEVLYTDGKIGRILRRPKNRVERYIADSFTGTLGCCGPEISFSPELFMETLDVMTESELVDMLEYFDRNGVDLVTVYQLSDTADETSPLAKEIRSGKMVSFRQFIDF